jgi:hypothetical protein
MTGRRDQARLDGLADMLTEAGEFLRSPGGHAALDEWYQARGLSRCHPGILTGWAGFTLLGLRKHAGQHQQRS